MAPQITHKRTFSCSSLAPIGQRPALWGSGKLPWALSSVQMEREEAKVQYAHPNPAFGMKMNPVPHPEGGDESRGNRVEEERYQVRLWRRLGVSSA